MMAPRMRFLRSSGSVSNSTSCSVSTVAGRPCGLFSLVVRGPSVGGSGVWARVVRVAAIRMSSMGFILYPNAGTGALQWMFSLCHAVTTLTKSPVIWQLGDGKPGHENQSLGLTDAIGRIMPCEVHRLSIAGVKGLFRRMKASYDASAGLPKPDLIIAAGHATHPSLVRLAKKHGAKSIVLMKPGLPMGWFDLCIVPEHDFPNGCTRGNVVLTKGALNRVAPPAGGARGGEMILVGGPSANHGWDGDALLDSLAEISKNGNW
ncbi:MAG: hypothetical protein EOP87_08545, partial [Verrucomicrobiaceae bacterium]